MDDRYCGNRGGNRQVSCLFLRSHFPLPASCLHQVHLLSLSLRCAVTTTMARSPEKIKMFSLTESGSDLAFFSPNTDPNEEEEVHSKPKSPLNPNPPPPFREAQFNENSTGEPSNSHERNPNPCADLNQETTGKSIEEPSCPENQSHGTEKSAPVSLVEGGAEVGDQQEMAVAANRNVLRKLPAWASNKSAEAEKGKCDQSVAQIENMKENALPLPGNLKEVIEALSGDFDEKQYADMNIVDILEIKGVVFENPSWWPTESYPDPL